MVTDRNFVLETDHTIELQHITIVVATDGHVAGADISLAAPLRLQNFSARILHEAEYLKGPTGVLCDESL